MLSVQVTSPLNTRSRVVSNMSRHTRISSFFLLLVCLLVLLILCHYFVQPTYQQDLCPKACRCDDKKLEAVCKDNIGASGFPQTLDPNTKRMIINYAQTTQFSSLDHYANLEAVDLAFNRISNIDFNDISKNRKLKSLNASHNIITEIKDSHVVKTINELGLVQSMPPTSDELRVLRKMDKISVDELILSHNQIKGLKDFTFLRWHKLQILDLSYNAIVTIESESLLGLNKLKIILLRGNRLVQVPTNALIETSKSWTTNVSPSGPDPVSVSIEQLDLSENDLQMIDRNSFHQFDRLQELYLDSCSVSIIDDGAFNGLPSLTILSLNKNNLREVPSSSFHNLGMLRTLKLNDNQITTIRNEAFLRLPHLEELELNNGLFKSIESQTFVGLYSIRRLEIANNSNLRQIESGALKHLTSLRYLSLEGNSLSTLHDNLNKQPALLFLDLRNNPLFCDCDLKWLTKWLRRFNDTATDWQRKGKASLKPEDTIIALADIQKTTELVNISCDGPPALANKLIAELPDNPLECLEPTSDLNVQIGFATLFFMITIMTSVCLLNLLRNKKQFMIILKDNLAPTSLSYMKPYELNLHKNVDELRKETQLGDYEDIDYNQKPVQVYCTSNSDNAVYYEPDDYLSH